MHSKSQILQTARQSDPFQTLVEVRSKSQLLQTVGQGHAFQTLVEFITKSQTDKASWQMDKANTRFGCQVCYPFQGKFCFKGFEPHQDAPCSLQLGRHISTAQDCCFCLCEALFLQSLVQVQSHCFLHLLGSSVSHVIQNQLGTTSDWQIV